MPFNKRSYVNSQKTERFSNDMCYLLKIVKAARYSNCRLCEHYKNCKNIFYLHLEMSNEQKIRNVAEAHKERKSLEGLLRIIQQKEEK